MCEWLTGMEAFSSEVVPPLGGTWPALATSPAGTRTVRQSGSVPHSHVAPFKTTTPGASSSLTPIAQAPHFDCNTLHSCDLNYRITRIRPRGGYFVLMVGPRVREKRWVRDADDGCAALLLTDAIERRRRQSAGA